MQEKNDGIVCCYLAINKVRHKTRCEVSNRNLGRITVFFDILLKLLWVVFWRTPGGNQSTGGNPRHRSSQGDSRLRMWVWLVGSSQSVVPVDNGRKRWLRALFLFRRLSVPDLAACWFLDGSDTSCGGTVVECRWRGKVGEQVGGDKEGGIEDKVWVPHKIPENET